MSMSQGHIICTRFSYNVVAIAILSLLSACGVAIVSVKCIGYVVVWLYECTLRMWECGWVGMAYWCFMGFLWSWYTAVKNCTQAVGHKSNGESLHYNDVTMGAMASQTTSLAIVYSTEYSGADQRKHQSSASLAFVWGTHRWPVNSPHKGPVTRKMCPFDDVIMGSKHAPTYTRNILTVWTVSCFVVFWMATTYIILWHILH